MIGRLLQKSTGRLNVRHNVDKLGVEAIPDLSCTTALSQDMLGVLTLC